MRKSAFLLAICIFLVFQVSAQQNPANPETKKSLENKPNKADLTLINNTAIAKPVRIGSPEGLAKADIKALKNGMLLVRLRTSDNGIAKLKNTGNLDRAAALEKQQAAENKKLIAAFKDHFKFAPVYFFYSTDSEKVKAGNLQGSLLDAGLKAVPENTIAGKAFFVAELTDIQQPQNEKVEAGQGNITGMTFRALVMRDSTMEQLAAPFPFYVKRIQNIPPHTRTEAEMVTLLNKKLETYYAENYPSKKR